MLALKQSDRAKRNANDLLHLRREQEVHSQLESDFIVPLFAAWETDAPDAHWLLLECQLCDLFDCVSAFGGKLSEESTQFVVACVGLAMEHMHSRQILFRDLKPENVLLAQDGYARLGDFGYACALAPEGRAKSLCGTEEVRAPPHTAPPIPGVATPTKSAPSRPAPPSSYWPQYSPPELLRGVGRSYCSDWWSVGILAHELLAGITPFPGTNPHATFAMIRGFAASEGAPPHQRRSTGKVAAHSGPAARWWVPMCPHCSCYCSSPLMVTRHLHGLSTRAFDSTRSTSCTHYHRTLAPRASQPRTASYAPDSASHTRMPQWT